MSSYNSINFSDLGNIASHRSGINKHKKNKGVKRVIEGKYAEQQFWKRARNIRFHKQSREDNAHHEEPAHEEPVREEHEEPVLAPEQDTLQNVYVYHTRTHFSDLNVVATTKCVNGEFERIERSLCEIHGSVLFFPELTMWKCTFAGEFPGTFEIRMWQQHGKLMLTAMRTSIGYDLDDAQVQFHDEFAQRLISSKVGFGTGPNEKFFIDFCDKYANKHF